MLTCSSGTSVTKNATHTHSPVHCHRFALFSMAMEIPFAFMRKSWILGNVSILAAFRLHRAIVSISVPTNSHGRPKCLSSFSSILMVRICFTIRPMCCRSVSENANWFATAKNRSLNELSECGIHEPIFIRNDSGIYSFDLIPFRNSRVRWFVHVIHGYDPVWDSDSKNVCLISHHPTKDGDILEKRRADCIRPSCLMLT